MLEARITALVAKLGEKIKYLFTWKAGRDENNTFTENNEFTKPLKVANPVNDGDAVNKGWVDKVHLAKAIFVGLVAGNDNNELGIDSFNTTSNVFEQNGDNIKVLKEGWYRISSNNETTPFRGIASVKGSASTINYWFIVNTSGSITKSVYLNANDEVYLNVQNNESTTNVIVCYLEIQKI